MTDIRRRMRAARAALTERERQRRSGLIVDRLRRDPWFRNATSIALYMPVGAEVDVSPLIEAGWDDGKRVLLPKLARDATAMRFAPFEPRDRLVSNRFGIPEPERGDTRSARTVDLVIAPVVAFDEGCNRLGMGAGYYDRALSERGRRPRRVGVAYELQATGPLETQPWDVPMHRIYTETRIVRRGG